MRARGTLIVLSLSVLKLLAGCGAMSAAPAAPPAGGQAQAAANRPTAAATVTTPLPALERVVPTGTPPLAPTVPRSTEIVDSVVNHPLVVQLVDGLQQRGFDVNPMGTSRVGFFRSAPGQAYRLAEGHLHLHVYPDAESAAVDARRVPKLLRTSTADYIAPINLFRCEQLIALYFGRDDALLGALGELCAHPFYSDLQRRTEVVATDGPLTTVDSALAWLLNNGWEATSAPQIRVQVPLTNGLALFYTYEIVGDVAPANVARSSYLDRRDPVWYPDGDRSEIYTGTEDLPPIQLLTGTYVVNGGRDTVELPDSVTMAGGLVSDPTIRQVRVVYSDGVAEVVPITEGAYLSARYDVERVERIEALNVLGLVVYQQEAE